MAVRLVRSNISDSNGNTVSEMQHLGAKQKGRRNAGVFASSPQIRPKIRPRSVLRDHRATPAVVDARGDHVDVLVDAVGPREYASEISEVVGVPSHEQMVVLNTSRPVLREGEFDTGADRAAPASLFRLVNRHAGHKTRVLVV